MHVFLDIDECSTAPCQNGGNCSMPQLNMFSCQCLEGYTGEMCETGTYWSVECGV